MRQRQEFFFSGNPNYKCFESANTKLLVLKLELQRNFVILTFKRPTRWPRGLRRRSAATQLLRLWVRIPSEGMDVCCGCCVLSGRGLCDELITRPEESCRLWCCVWSRNLVNGEALAPPQKKKRKEKRKKYIWTFYYCNIKNFMLLLVGLCTVDSQKIASRRWIKWLKRGTSKVHHRTGHEGPDVE